MKILNPIFFLILFIVAWGLQSCDKVKEPYAEIKPAGGDTNYRMILLEDYTGHKCVNCPAAGILARDLEELYKGQIMVMAVHATWFATPDQTGDFTANYTTEAGNTWSSEFQIESAPYGLINRRYYSGSHIYLNPKYWGNAVQDFVELPKVAIMSINNVYNDATRSLSTKIETKFLEQTQGTINLTVCILEDSIVSPQKNNDPLVGSVPVIYQYVYMDMLRGNVSGIWGDELTTSVIPNTVYSKSYTFQMNEAWVAPHCWILAFISDANTHEILQTVRKKVDPDNY